VCLGKLRELQKDKCLLLQVLNLENFQITMYSVIRATNYASALFWLAWIILGKYIFLTLFLAVTLDAFERKYEVRASRCMRYEPADV
jgi:hypothetical protein